jgi:hypothetical protein
VRRRRAILDLLAQEEAAEQEPVALLRQRVEDLSSASVALKQLADAEEPLLNSFDDAQKQLFSTYASNARDRRDRTKR